MKKGILLSLALTLALGAACTQTAINDNTAMNRNGMMNSNSMMNMNGMNHNGMTSGNSMNHNGMMNSNMPMMNHSEMKSSPNAASAPYDLQFLDTMTHHHQGALDMAKVAVGKTQNQELKAFAQKIIADQNKEIAQMKEWREKWYAGKPSAMNMEMPGMGDGMKMMMGDGMKKFEAASGKEFDLMFLDMMTPHHQGAVTMGREALTKAEHQEIKTLSNNIIKAQEAEIKQMQMWKTAWSK